MKNKITIIALIMVMTVGGLHVTADKLGVYDFINAIATIINEGKLEQIGQASVKLNESTVNNAPQISQEIETKMEAELEAEKQRQIQRLESETISYFNQRRDELNVYVDKEILPAKKAEMSKMVDAHIKGQQEWIDDMIEEVIRHTKESYDPQSDGKG